MSSRLKILIKDCAIDEDYIYFIASKMNLIFSFNISTKKIEIIGMIPESIGVKENYLGCITVCNKELYICPEGFKNIWIYNLESHVWNKLIRKQNYDRIHQRRTC